jgi:iron(III) transport system ATP-binding protein
VQSELGQVTAYCDEPLAVDDEVTLSVRPEDIELREALPQGENVWEGRVDQKIFLGEVVDFQVRVGDRILLSRAQPSLRTPVGERIFCQIQPEKCVALKAADETNGAGRPEPPRCLPLLTGYRTDLAGCRPRRR